MPSAATDDAVPALFRLRCDAVLAAFNAAFRNNDPLSTLPAAIFRFPAVAPPGEAAPVDGGLLEPRDATPLFWCDLLF